jgi:hypothetical protein
MQLSVGSRWIDARGCEFAVEDVDSNGAEIWVTYIRTGDHTRYRCLVKAFEHRFRRTENDSR